MVYWITGRKDSGKTTLAYRIAGQVNGVVIDGDEVRQFFPTGWTDDNRFEHIMMMARFARLLEKQGKIVIVACVSPKRKWREKARLLFDECVEICMPFGELWEGTIYQEPEYEEV